MSEVLDLGQMPLAGDFRPLGETNVLYDLSIDVCAACGALQVRNIVDPAILFTTKYSYVSSTVPALVRHFEEYAAEVALPPADSGLRTLLEIGCNDGIFLAPLKKAGYRVLGVDASANVVDLARLKGLEVENGMFDASLASKILAEHGPFDIVTCSNVLAHDPNVNAFVEAAVSLLKPSGEFWIEVHSATVLYETLQWDCFYHEHCFNWTLRALDSLMRRHGLNIKRYKTTAMHGGALRAVFSRNTRPVVVNEPVLRAEDWAEFGQRCRSSRAEIREKILALPVRYAYGAAGRAVVLINWTGLADRLDYVVDGGPMRIGRVVPNTTVPIISEQDYFETKDPGEYCFVTAHNYLESIRNKVKSRFPDRAIKFVTPLPHVTVQ